MWRDIESAPRDKPVLIYGGTMTTDFAYGDWEHTGPTIATMTWDGATWDAGWAEGVQEQAWIKNPTHWMPLPDPPQPSDHAPRMPIHPAEWLEEK